MAETPTATKRAKRAPRTDYKRKFEDLRQWLEIKIDVLTTLNGNSLHDERIDAYKDVKARMENGK